MRPSVQMSYFSRIPPLASELDLESYSLDSGQVFAILPGRGMLQVSRLVTYGSDMG